MKTKSETRRRIQPGNVALMKKAELIEDLSKEREENRRLGEELRTAHGELARTNSELLQLTLELDDRVAERTKALEESEGELREHRDRLQELVDERTSDIKLLNQTLAQRVFDLKKSEDRFKSLVATIPDIVYRIDAGGRFTFVNNSIRQIGFEPEDLIGRHFREVVLAKDVDKVSREKVLPRLEGKNTGDSKAPKLFDERRTGERMTTGLEVRLMTKSRKLVDGKLRPIGGEQIVVEISSAGVYELEPVAKKQKFVGTTGVIRDITERKRLEGRLRKAHGELERKVKERTADLLATNKTLEEQIVERKKIEAELQKLLGQLKKSQSQLVVAEKMSAVGTMTAGIAHELNNPMMGMLNFVQYCLKNTADSDKRHAVLKDTERETLRCIEIVKNLLTFSRIDSEGEETPAEEYLSRILDRVHRLLAYRLETENVRFERRPCSNPIKIPLKVSSMQQVFLNFIGNSLDAVSAQEEKEIIVAEARHDDVVEIVFADNGCGISDGHLQKMFDPFFTTKPPGKGTGLGLSLCQSIVEDHGGTIACESTVGKGTTFRVRLPVGGNRN